MGRDEVSPTARLPWSRPSGEWVSVMVERASWANMVEARARFIDVNGRASSACYGEFDDELDDSAWDAHFQEAVCSSDVLALAIPVASFKAELAYRKVIREEAGIVKALTADDYLPLEIPASAWAEFQAADEAAHMAQHDAFAVAHRILWPYRPDDGSSGAGSAVSNSEAPRR